MLPTEQIAFQYIGKPIENADALERVTGQARFGADLHPANMLWGKVLRSPYAHARIRRIDASRALALRGIRAIVTAADLPPATDADQASSTELPMPLKVLRPLSLAHDRALFDGHAVAAVAATTPEAATEALQLIEVDYEPLPVVENALEATAQEDPLLHADLYTRTAQGPAATPSNISWHVELGRGDVEGGMAAAAAVVERSYATAMAHPGYIEPQARVARCSPGDTICVWTSTQGLFDTQHQLSALLGIAVVE